MNTQLTHGILTTDTLKQGAPLPTDIGSACNTTARGGLLELVEVSKLLISANYREVLDIAVHKGAEMQGCEGCCIIIENKKGNLILKTGFPRSSFEIGRGIGAECAAFLRDAIGKGEGILSVVHPWCPANGWRHELLSGYAPQHPMLFVPLYYRGESLGVMLFVFGANGDQGRFCAGNLEKIRAISSLVSAAIGAAYAKMRDEKKMAQRERLSMLGQNSASVAHTIRNALTSVGGFANRLCDKLSEESPGNGQIEAARQYAGIISSEVQKLESITRGVLTYARFSCQRLNRTGCNIHEYIGKLIAEWELLYPEIVIDYFHDRHDVTLRIDTTAIEICMADLIRNAVEAAAEHVYIRTKIKSKERRFLITVGNDGEEISPSILDKIFDPFMTTKADGTGLGLANVRAIITAHGGDVKALSKNHTTEFHIYLPLA